MSSQVAKMYLRGSLCNKVMKGLSEDERQEIEDIITQVVGDPLLQQCRQGFKNALAGTIKNEYADLDVGEADYHIAIMRAAVAAKHGWGENKPAPAALNDPIQRKKFFQTWAFNYLRQILRENKIPAINTSQYVIIAADTAALYATHEAVAKAIKAEKDIPYRRSLRAIYEKAEIIDHEDGYSINFNHWVFPVYDLSSGIIDIVQAVNKVREKYMKYQVQIMYTEEGIDIRRLVPVVPEIRVPKKKSVIIKETSFDAASDDEDESRRDQLEVRAMHNSTHPDVIDEEDILMKLRRSIPTEAVAVLDIYMEDSRPDDYIAKYGPNTPKAVDVAEYLDRPIKDVKAQLRAIKHHCLALGVGH